MLTVVMYHYVRKIAGSDYPGVKGRELAEFEGQLDYLQRHYKPVHLTDILDAIRETRPLPGNAAYLTFDDGFADHYRVVLPALARRGLSGSFFPPAKPVLERCVLDVHKLHFVLCQRPDASALVAEMLDLVRDHRGEHEIPPDDSLLQQYSASSRFDSREVVFLKRTLQKGLPEQVRRSVLSTLFARHVTSDESGFAGQLYLTLEQLRTMVSAGMVVGSHGYDHRWWGTLADDEQASEIDRSLEFLDAVYGGRLADWTVSYPYGSYNADTLQILASRKCALGWTTRVAVVESLEAPLELPRLDTNDLPVHEDAAAGTWTERVNGSTPS